MIVITVVLLNQSLKKKIWKFTVWIYKESWEKSWVLSQSKVETTKYFQFLQILLLIAFKRKKEKKKQPKLLGNV